MNMMDGICGKVAPGLCRLSMDGGIAVKTRAGYRSYDPESKRLTNCDSFVLDVGDDFFFVVPVNRVKPGDIILAGGLPKYVTAVQEDTITVLNFEDTTVETLVPERHMFMGSMYLYGRIVSLFGKNGAKGKKGLGRMMKYMMLSGFLKGKENSSSGLMAMMLLGGKDNFVDDMFGSDEDEEEKEA
ncbi:MAG: hypothetical protein IKP86_10835 [Anaerolineaceae bacterium]|nr:hypothetical protein [Anaerolineaceae bacterium]